MAHYKLLQQAVFEYSFHPHKFLQSYVSKNKILLNLRKNDERVIFGVIKTTEFSTENFPKKFFSNG